MIEYKGEIIEKVGKGYMYDSMLFPQWDMLTRYIDAKLEGGKFSLFEE